jgi:hypothetical protein
MIILDTNVVSEPLRPEPAPQVLAWLDAQPMGRLFLTTITWAELLSGVAVLPVGRRRAELQSALTQRVLPLFEDRMLAFDAAAAEAFAAVHAGARAAGNPIGFADGAIAAVAAARGFTLATRNVRDFLGTRLRIVNPWE